ncbi:alpha-soluble NSF attachment protein-like [Pyxicephalus adspersus]|uniref:alpha-soluble NSF attachment protein-like n=1 Tax=Pyxicephalus adspersus TaxID=30357 RepID=UPI003B5B25E3
MDNSGKEKEAMQLLAEAEKKVKSSQSFFSGLFGGSSKVEEACDLYARAANMFKMVKNWSAAGNAFCQAAQLHLQVQSKHDAATNFVDAGNAFKKSDPQEAINCLLRAIEIYTDMGRFTIAAKHHISIAEIYESELVDIEKVWCCFAFTYRFVHNAIVHLYCHVAVSLVIFFLSQKLLEAHEEQNVDNYTDAVKEYDSISRLDQWMTTMLLRIKKTVKGEEEDLR